MSDSADDKRRAFEAKMKALRDSYVEALPGKLAQIREHWATLHSLRRYPAELVMPFRNEVHKLAGSGASYGFSSLSTLMQRIEQRLDQLVDFPEDSEPLVVEISELMQQIESFDKPQDMAGSEEVSVGLKKSRPSVPRVLLVGSSAEAMKRLPEQISVFGFDVVSVDYAHAKQKYDVYEPEIVICLEEAGEKCPTPAEFSQSAPPVIFSLHPAPNLMIRIAAYRHGIREVLPDAIDPAELVDRLESCFARDESDAYRVLIVDDDSDQADQFTATLEAASMEVRVANGPEKLQEILTGYRPDVILMDLHLQGYNGIELSAALRQDPMLQEVPIIFQSVAKDLNSHMGAIRAGGDDFLAKPVAPAFLAATMESRARRYRQLSAMLQNDGLTGLMNHRSSEEFLQRAVAHEDRIQGDLVVVMVDLDHFKRVNDRYGHPVGDRVLVNFSRFLKGRMRKSDIVGRYGGEEFIIVLTETTLASAKPVIESLRVSFGAINHLVDGDVLNVTFSAGLAAYPEFTTAGALIQAADKALYEAKRSGRNCCRIQRSESSDSDKAEPTAEGARSPS